ncbi:MAG: NADPH-dependent glutamate synthase [Candidatus Goldiibacteriota bacterium]
MTEDKKNIPRAKRPKIEMRQQAPRERIKNADEVPLGYSEKEAMEEASRCLQCKEPKCESGCPVNIKIRDFIKEISLGNHNEALKIIKKTNSLPAVCGRVCPQEEQCEERCIMQKTKNPINIGGLERFAADWAAKNAEPEPVEIKKKTDKDGNPLKIAIAGAGPAGITAAYDLAVMGYDVTVYEAMHIPGGVLIYGIPEFRLPKSIVAREVEYLKEMGVKFEMNVIIGKSYTLDDLKKMGFKAVFIGVGAGTPMFMNIPGETLKGVYSANEFLTRINAMKGYLFPEYDTPVKIKPKIAVIGAGNVAMDSARWAKRLKGVTDVYVVYRRSEKEMPARAEEIERAKEEGIDFRLLTNPVEILSDENGWVKGLKVVKMELGEPDDSGRRRPVPIKGSEYTIDVDIVIPALGTKANELLTSDVPGLKLNKWGNIEADPETGATSLEGVFAGGDITTGSATVIAAMGAARKSAKAIDKYVSGMEE